MKKALMVGAMAVAAFCASHSAQAKNTTYTYQFETASGYDYCDGLDVTVSSKTLEAIGLHTYYQAYCPYKNTYVGGYGGSIKALGAGTWFTLTASQEPGSPESELYTIIYYANFAKLTWALAVESSYEMIPFELVNSGVLGAPLGGAVHSRKVLGSTAKLAISGMHAQHNLK